MQRFFTHYWKYSTARQNPIGEPLVHAAGGIFTQRGIRKGDVVYIFTLDRGRLYLIGKMEVGDIVFSDKEAERLVGYQPWSASEHLIARAGTPIQMEKLPLDAVKQLQFVSRAGRGSLKVRAGKVEPQAMRGVRQLEGQSATELDKHLPPMVSFVPGG